MAKNHADAIQMLKADHRTVEDLFDKYEHSRGKKADIARKICMELIVHTLLEEEIFYPACRRASVDAPALNEAAVEHDGAKILISELEHALDDDFYDAKVKVLSEEIKHHVKEEEKRGGIMAQAKSKGLDLAALGERMAQLKKELLSEIDENDLPTPSTRTMKAPALERACPSRKVGAA